MKKLTTYVFAFALALFCTNGIAQLPKYDYTKVENPIWKQLLKVEYEVIENYDKYGDALKPIFSEAIRQLDGQPIIISGYIYPIKGKKKLSSGTFSALPARACFFNGKGGPESVAHIQFKETIKYTPEYIQVKGVLHLNDSSLKEMIYFIDEAELLVPEDSAE